MIFEWHELDGPIAANAQDEYVQTPPWELPSFLRFNSTILLHFQLRSYDFCGKVHSSMDMLHSAVKVL